MNRKSVRCCAGPCCCFKKRVILAASNIGRDRDENKVYKVQWFDL